MFEVVYRRGYFAYLVKLQPLNFEPIRSCFLFCFRFTYKSV